jgi:tryptophan synthase alpha chain
MSRIAACFESLASRNRKALTTFITAGDPTIGATVPALLTLAEAGADLIELGIPFSDPEAEGPAIQASSERGLANGTTLAMCLDMVREFRSSNQTTPVVLMGYLNSVLAMGERTFAEAARDAGVDGLIMVNLPPEEADVLRPALADRDIDLIFLVAPTTTPERLKKIVAAAAGFVYYVSLKGITGADLLDVSGVAERVAEIKSVTALPVQVGFGIKDGRSARAVAEHADGVVVGSALVNTMADHTDPDERLAALREQVNGLRQALDA